MRVFEVDGYDPEYRTLVLRDPVGYEPAGSDPDDQEPAGTFAGAGIGWLAATTNGGGNALRLEAHDEQPPADESAFDDVMETPYHAITGRLSLTVLTGGVGGRTNLELGDGGIYRVRVARQANPGGEDRWLFQFWPDPSPAPPVWRVRSRPGVGGGYDGWSLELPSPVNDVHLMVNAAARTLGRAVTVDDVDEWTRTHRQHSSDWLDAPLWPPPGEPQFTGNADRDRLLAAQHATASARMAGMRRRLDEIAAELGVPPVRNKRDVLPLLAAAGLLVRDDAGRHRAGKPKRVDTVLSLPPKRAEIARASDARSRYEELAHDVVAVLRWTSTARLETTPAQLAERLLVTEAQLHEVLGYAEQTGMLHTDGTDRLLLSRGPRRQPGPVREVRTTSPHRYGAPPRAGVVSADGIVLVWQDGDPRELAYLGTGPWNRALATASGILVLPEEDRFPRLVTPTGEVRIVDRQLRLNAALLGDGHRLAVVDGEHRLQVVDLSGALPDAHPWASYRPVLLHGSYRDTVYFTELPTRTAFRWTPGREPEACGHPIEQVDPYSGTCSWLTSQGVMVSRPHGPAAQVSVNQFARLTPGGDHLWLLEPAPLTLTFVPVEPGTEVRRWALPDAHEPVTEPIWEDTDHLLITGHPQRAGEPSADVRLSVRDGACERLPGVEALRPPLTFVEPRI